MKNIDNISNIPESHEKLSAQSEAFVQMLTRRGLLEDADISDDKARQSVKSKKRNMYHNTELMLKHYRDINWALECFPDEVADELNRTYGDLDSLLSLVDAELGKGNPKLEGQLQSIQKSRMLIDRFNRALTILKKKPGNGERMYQCLYLTYIIPETISHSEILFRLDISSRHYYRLRQQAIGMLSIQLWSAPTSALDAWLEVLTLLEAM